MKVINLLALFLVISLTNTEELKFLESNAGMPIMDKIAGLSNGILCIMNGVQSVLDAFKSSKSTIIKRIIEKEGFNTFVGKTNILISQGVAASNLSKYQKVFKILAKIPDKYSESIDSFMENIEFVDGDAWASYDFLFNVKNADPDTTSYASCIGTHNTKSDTYDFFTVANTIHFKLAPHLMIMEDSLSVAGGIYSHQKERIVELPRELTNEDMKLIMKFFQAISFRALGNFFGMNLPSIS